MRILAACLATCLMMSGCMDSGSAGSPEAFSVAAKAVEGSPLDVLFRIEVEGDASGLEWSLDAEGDGLVDAGGSTFPVEVVHSFALAGVYDALVVLSGDGDPLEQTVTVEVTGVEPVVLQGSTSVASGPQKRDTGHLDCVGFQIGQDGMDCIWFELDGMDGWTFKADSDGPVADVEFLTTCDPRATSSLGMFTGNASGKVPAGSGCALLWDYGSIPATMTLTLHM